MKNNEMYIKIVMALILTYQLLYAEAFGQIPFLLPILYIILDLLFFFYKIPSIKKIFVSVECIALVLFIIFSMLFGFVVTSYKQAFLRFIIFAVEYLILFLSVYEIVKKEKKIDFFIWSIFIITVLTIFVSLVRQKYIYQRLVIGVNSNANTLGNICIVCISMCMYILDSYKKGWLVILSVLPFVMYTGILTGSKKAFLISIMIIVVYSIFRFREWLKAHALRVALILFVGLLLVYIYRNRIVSLWHTTNLYSRILRSRDIDIGRIELYIQALEVFKNNPVFGVGYQCFQFYSSSGLYAHSAYAEVLTGTGLVGMVLWGLFYFGTFFKSLRKAIKFKKNTVYAWTLMWMICQILLDTTSVSLYSPINMVLLAIVLAIADSSEYTNNQIKG